MPFEQMFKNQTKFADIMMKCRADLHSILGVLVMLGASALGFNLALSASLDTPSHLRLIDRLDRPQDGYCLDIPGAPPNIRVELPLFAHNCMTSLTIDTSVVLTSDGYIRFPNVKRCVTVMGIHSSLPGATVRLGECNPPNPFIDISKLQRFTHHPDGRLTLTDTDLCLSVGSRSAETLSPIHRWRTLFVEDCAVAKPARSRWEFIVPKG
ncbi:MAG: hypothetical protein COA78_17640 [Blastopirellula sp.]|nr:MAG: hypothetical protein COA78_17640 [Blastopirellula sp.]